ncbi:hypothetical protein DPMN_154851 [Dreissena polymorpha]|uniref:Uncharacterized protein n=1 Tax=Dreissena polymorpha TaxID=45954 RepID=A0A9D4FLA6_DREPO|nr:hypothetical protein DPMN_154851 [Dreissena polymorpha]
MWTDGQRTKTNPKTSPEQSGKLPYPPGSHFHDDWAKNVTSRVFTIFFSLYTYKKTAPPPGSHVIQLTGTIFQLNSCIKETNVMTKFHENWAKNVTSRVFTYFHDIQIEKNAPPTGGHVFSLIWTIFELVRHINKTNLHEDWALNVTSTVLKLDREIIGTNLLTKFHEDRTKNVASRMFRNKCGRTDDGQRPVTKDHLSNQVS